MNVAVAIELFAASLGLFSSAFFCVGVLHLKDSTLESIATRMWGKGELIAVELAQQKSDFVFGALLLFSAFTAQFVARLGPPEMSSHRVADSVVVGALGAFGLAGLFVLLLYFPYRRHRRIAVDRLNRSTEGKL
ncbi:hypothetical protein [Methyloversatilis discipulorum]|uniref:hypothetical protein n=1 Tax=Methyloversatilis discipulorum TaxID=1119528 RepID=UPI0012FC6DC3|nr:hypothetical protein [Methyloversatilis discipulorum]